MTAVLSRECLVALIKGMPSISLDPVSPQGSESETSVDGCIVSADEPHGPNGEHHFVVTVDRSSGKRLGVAVRQETSIPAFEILSIDVDEDCAVVDWNAEHPTQKVRKGDFIIEANDKNGDLMAIMHECMKTSVLQLRIMRRRG
mmetsp:Transcript_28792/g.75854  ORF Transcript_28792/g.75854 Transcript_28792/m.75854 type:complete len:144 (-) Transcript_28792:250-681(-)|eukprot:CAMPEP_0194507120 /NCGR_PEP_ID=MMETSP0253-20130528/36149_1 /TAXON_ID=2966 /ORGANISM="Noctiluca scintillans" /LENGTH=143 /DNA_ID=CAMNT_0039349955 /DNA_START=85 /DNA_END=516 /DNA_ORIENTATION=+